MLNDLPKFVQKQILVYLNSNNFSAAKTLHDAWIGQQAIRSRLNLPPLSAMDAEDLSIVPPQQASLLAEMLAEE